MVASGSSISPNCIFDLLTGKSGSRPLTHGVPSSEMHRSPTVVETSDPQDPKRLPQLVLQIEVTPQAEQARTEVHPLRIQALGLVVPRRLRSLILFDSHDADIRPDHALARLTLDGILAGRYALFSTHAVTSG
jgi:hypothetical protein